MTCSSKRLAALRNAIHLPRLKSSDSAAPRAFTGILTDHPGPSPLETVIIHIMPFTLSHAAAALPFRRTRLVISALVFGCFAPDFGYFIPFASRDGIGHTLMGVFEFDIPVAFVALWLFHHYAKEPLAACLPRGARNRVHIGPKSLSIKSPSRLAVILLSILMGAATHILWDSFTHDDYWHYHHWHLLGVKVALPLFGPRPWFAIFQYISSALGLLLILIWFVHWYRSTSPIHPRPDLRPPAVDRIVLACAFAVAFIAALVRAAAPGIPNGVHGSQRFMTDAAVTGITIFWIEVVIYGIWRNYRRRTISLA